MSGGIDLDKLPVVASGDVWTADGSALYREGQAFYWPPGHAPEALEDTDILEISPTRDLVALHAHVSGG